MTDNPTAAFLRGVLAAGNDVTPTEVLGGPDLTAEQEKRIMQFTERLADFGYVESAMPGTTATCDHGDLVRVRVTASGLDYLAEH